MEINVYLNVSAIANQEFDPENYLHFDTEEEVLNAVYEDFRIPLMPYMQDCSLYVDSIEEIVYDIELRRFLEKWRELKGKENE